MSTPPPSEPMGMEPMGMEPMGMEPGEPMGMEPSGTPMEGMGRPIRNDQNINYDELQGIDNFVNVRDSPISGRGVFAIKNIPKGKLIGVCPAIEVSEWQVTGKARSLTYVSPREGHLLLAAGSWMLVNHSEQPNTSCSGTEKMLHFTTLRKIAKGEELTIDYGFDPKETVD